MQESTVDYPLLFAKSNWMALKFASGLRINANPEAKAAGNLVRPSEAERAEVINTWRAYNSSLTSSLCFLSFPSCTHTLRPLSIPHFVSLFAALPVCLNRCCSLTDIKWSNYTSHQPADLSRPELFPSSKPANHVCTYIHTTLSNKKKKKKN